MRIGGHISIEGGFTQALKKTIDIGGNTMQIFASSPQIWTFPSVSQNTTDEFIKLKNQLDINPIYFHSSYLINLADSTFIGEKSRQRILDELILSERLQIKGTIIHLGSYKEKNYLLIPNEKYKILLNNISWVLERLNSNSYFIIENAGNRKIGWNINEIANIISDLKDQRIKICLDTCHLHAAGYDLSTEEKYIKFFSEIDKKIGINNLEVFQINDSKDQLGSFRDRHENINEGTLPTKTFELLINNEITKNIPFILEVPGKDKNGSDFEQLKRFKSYFKKN